MPNPDASQWNIGVVGTQRKIFALAMYISCFLCRFHLRLVANANPVSGGIWALNYLTMAHITLIDLKREITVPILASAFNMGRY